MFDFKSWMLHSYDTCWAAKHVYLADTVWDFLNTSLTYGEDGCAKGAIQFFLFYYYFKYINIYILNLDDNQNGKANVKTGFLVWMGFIWVSLFHSFYCGFSGGILIGWLVFFISFLSLIQGDSTKTAEQLVLEGCFILNFTQLFRF